MSRFSCLAVVVVIGIGTAFSQMASREKSSCSFTELYKNDGWNIPGLNEAKVVGQRAALANMHDVFVTVLKTAKPEGNILQIRCDRDHSGRIDIGEFPIRILELWSFDVGGRVFAYRVSYGDEIVQSGARVPLGAASTVIFYDIDGSGRFTVSRGGGYVPEFIPSWVKNPSDAASRK